MDKSIVDMAIEHGNKISEKPEKHMNFFSYPEARKGIEIIVH
uniref:Uncharacterized protein n=1 Tax=Anguilla anguilla TaxID=7936 RepID=A0A0E9Y2P7_ANGAN